jgi:hypothetical protein
VRGSLGRWGTAVRLSGNGVVAMRRSSKRTAGVGHAGASREDRGQGDRCVTCGDSSASSIHRVVARSHDGGMMYRSFGGQSFREGCYQRKSCAMSSVPS